MGAYIITNIILGVPYIVIIRSIIGPKPYSSYEGPYGTSPGVHSLARHSPT